MPLHLYNSLTKRVEPFVPADPSHVTFYTCGPTVYDDAHIGNFRSFLAADLLRRFIESPLCELANETPAQAEHRKAHGRRVTHVMNITDVGHMTDDAEGGEAGEDRMAVAGRRIAEAKKAGTLPAGVEVDPRDPYAIAKFYEGRFREDARKLGLKVSLEAEKDESLHPKATANVPGMIAVIKRLLTRKAADGRPHAYVAGEPGARAVYFRVRSFAGYGSLSGNTLDKLREGEGGRVNAANQSQKDHPADFLLWKEDPSHIMAWGPEAGADFGGPAWGRGYPGWHIECTAMSVARLAGDATAARLGEPGYPWPGYPGAIIDLHSGGEDNIFPHHECEIAQSCCAFNADPAGGSFASMWFHPRFLLVEGAKMSKSKGNFFTARDLFAKGIEPAALRLELIKTHYRSNANFRLDLTDSYGGGLENWRLFARAASRHLDVKWVKSDRNSTKKSYAEQFAVAMHDDLNAWNAFMIFMELMESRSGVTNSLALAGVEDLNNYRDVPLPITPLPPEKVEEEWRRGRSDGSLREWWALTHLLDAVMGVVYVPDINSKSTVTEIGVFAPGVTPSAEVESLLAQRRDARARKDFKASDAIRDQLAGMGYAIKDMAGGKVEVRRA